MYSPCMLCRRRITHSEDRLLAMMRIGHRRKTKLGEVIIVTIEMDDDVSIGTDEKEAIGMQYFEGARVGYMS